MSPQSGTGPINVVCRYRVKPKHEQEFADLLREHWGVLHAQGLTTADRAKLLRATDNAGNVAFIEMFAWRDAAAVQAAHESPAIMKKWEPMGAFCEDMEFWHVQDF